MKVDNMFPSKYLRAADLPRPGMTLTIDAIQQEQIGGDDKYVLYFLEEERGLALNKTNALAIACGRKRWRSRVAASMQSAYRWSSLTTISRWGTKPRNKIWAARYSHYRVALLHTEQAPLCQSPLKRRNPG
jgi:hypothetical protein